MGDALKFEDASDPGKGLVFDGRLAEDFKLASGTWVSTGALRAQFIDHCAPLVRDAVIAGLNRDDIAALVFPDVEACRKLAGLAADAAARRGAGRCRKCATNSRSASMRWRDRAPAARPASAGSILMAEPPSLDAGEATDKGSINQRAVLTRRAALVEELYAGKPSANVIAIDERK